MQDYGVQISESGHGLVTVTSDKVLVEFIALGGTVLDSYTIE